MRQQFALAVAVHQMHVVRHQFGGAVGRRDLHQLRVVQEGVGQCLDVVVEGGGEQQVLPLGRQELEHLAHVTDEAHVEHAVGLVQHEDFHPREVHGLLLGQIDQPARRSDQDVDTLGQRLDLRLDAHATEDHQRSQRQVCTQRGNRLAHLGGQFAGRCQDQPARPSGRMRVRVGRRQPLQQWQGKAGGLAGARLGSGHQIPSRQHGRNRLALDRGRFGVASLGDRTQQWIDQLKVGKGNRAHAAWFPRPPLAFARPIRADSKFVTMGAERATRERENPRGIGSTREREV